MTCAVFAAVAHFGLLSVIEDKFYKPMVYSRLEERNDLLSETVGKYIDTQDALFTLFAANPEIRVITQKEQDEMLVKSRANLASDLLTETPGLEGLRIIGKNGKTIYYSTFSQDFAARKDDEPASYRNYPKNDIPFEDIAASEEDKSRILHDSENNRLIFSYPFYDNEMAFVGTVAFYVDAPSMLRYFIPTDRLSAQSGIYLWGTQKEDIHGFVFSVPEGLETVCKNAAVSSWNSNQKIYAFEDPESIGNRAKYLLVSAENKNGFVSTVFKEDILYMPERIRNIIVLATISLIFFISIICCIAKNAAEKHAERPSLAKEDKMLAAEAASEVSIRAEEPKKDESLIEKIDDVFEMLAAESVPAEKPKHAEIAEAAEENAEPQFDYDSQEFGDTLFEDSPETEEAPESASGADETADGLFEEIYNEEIQSEQAAQLEAGAQPAPLEVDAQFADDAQLGADAQPALEAEPQFAEAGLEEAVQPLLPPEQYAEAAQTEVYAQPETGAQVPLEADTQFADDAPLEAGAQSAPLQLEDDSLFADDAAQIEDDAQLAQPAALEEEAEQLEIEIPAFDESEFEETDNIQAEPAAAQPIPTESTAAFLSAIDERIHQRQEIIEEYTQPLFEHDEHEEVAEAAAAETASAKADDVPEISAEAVAAHSLSEAKHGLLSAGNAYLEEEHKKEAEDIKCAPLRKSSLSSLFKEKVMQNQTEAEKRGGLHTFVQQEAPSAELSDISQHGLLSRSDDYRSNLPQKPALYTLDLKKNIKTGAQSTDKQNIQSAVEQQKEKNMDTSFYDETIEELEPAVETETVTSIFALQGAPQLFAAFANKQPEQEQRGSFERKGIADRIVESTTAKMTPVFTEPEHKIDNIHIENGVYRIHEEKDAASNVKINYDFKRLVDSVLNG
ncbi:MAG: hypothetical protein PUF61_09835 [Spirochaetales bacterium]|nr:hypothetical protein [Spirochaetales bacterium]